jgi:transcriptional regulator with XRE-family HTH domain
MSDTNGERVGASAEPIYSFGAWVRDRRQALRMTQREVADLTSCSLVLLRKVERDERRPSALVAERLLGLVATQ